MRANGLSGKIRLASGSTLLVPAGNGAEDLETVIAGPRLPQIIEPEPPAKAAKTTPAVAKATDKRSGKADKAAKAKPGNTRAVVAKPAPAPAKVAKSSNGRRI